jgi:hypothetical protein
MGFAVIGLPDGLTAAETAEAMEAGPPNSDADGGYRELLTTAGFVNIETVDVTHEYLETATAWVRAWDDEAVDLMRIVGEEAFAERQSNRRRSIAAIGNGLLVRHLISARKP